MFINFSNHPSGKWSIEQIRAAEEFGQIKDFPFPEVSPAATGEEIAEMAEKIKDEILQMHPDAVLCQGEFTLAYAVTSRLKRENIKVIAACSERRVEEVVENNATVKRLIFRFAGFREYL